MYFWLGYEQYQAVGEQIDEWLVGQRTQDGTEIKGFVSHFVDRIIGQQAANDIPMPGMRRGVAIEDALEALRNPVSVGQIQISSNGLKSVTYEGRNCIARVNPDTGMLIQCNPN